MDSQYAISDTSGIYSPALIVYREIMVRNLRRMIEMAGEVSRLRPHCKTHKMPAVTKIELGMGLTKHKCATFAEAEMLANCGVKDIFLAYNLVGPNISRAKKFLQKFPDVKLAVTADDLKMIEELSNAMSSASLTIRVLLDLDPGLHRTGVVPGELATRLYQRIAELPGLQPGGFHLYDGQNHQTNLAERTTAVLAGWTVAMLTRVISRPTSDRLTCDLGNKSVASDPPKGQRVLFPDLPDAEQVLHNEEHLVLQTPLASRYQPGDELLAIPKHVCPTSALHKQAYVVEAGNVVEMWDVTARDRFLTI